MARGLQLPRCIDDGVDSSSAAFHSMCCELLLQDCPRLCLCMESSQLGVPVKHRCCCSSRAIGQTYSVLSSSSIWALTRNLELMLV
jgi:hypothetical protein